MPTVADTRHPEYPEATRRAAFALAHYGGDLYERLPASPTIAGRETGRENLGSTGYDGDGALHGLKAEPFLVRHGQGESEEAFLERRRISAAVPYYGFAVDGLAGQVLAAEDDAERTWGEGPLGDPTDPASVMARLWESADGRGTDWRTLYAQLAPRLVAVKRWGLLVEAGATSADDPSVRMVPPRAVVDWQGDPADPEWVVIQEVALAPRQPGEEAEDETTYLTITREGWRRERANDDGGMDLVEEDTHDYRHPDGRARCPFRFVGVPLDRDIGYQMAQVANNLLNHASTVDFRFWTACINRLHLDTGEDSSTKIGDIIDTIKEHGQSVIVTRNGGSAAYINPSQEPALAAWSVLKEKVVDFFVTFFRAYGNEASAQRTATEIRQQNDLGVEGYLVMLATALDEAENFALSTLEQAVRPPQTARGKKPRPQGAKVERARSYQPILPLQIAEGLVSRYFGDRVPAGPETLKAAAERVHQLDGLPSDTDETERAVEAATAERAVRPDRMARLRAGAGDPAGDGAGGDGAVVEPEAL